MRIIMKITSCLLTFSTVIIFMTLVSVAGQELGVAEFLKWESVDSQPIVALTVWMLKESTRQ